MQNYKFDIKDAVIYEDTIGRIEERAVDPNGRNLYLVQLVLTLQEADGISSV